MVIVRGVYEITELVAGSVGSVGLYMAGCNVIPLIYDPDIASALFILASVIIVHRFRVLNFPPIEKLWRLLLELVVFYIATQLMLAFIWESFHGTLDFIRDAVLHTFVGLTFLKDYPKVTLFFRTDVNYTVQLVVSVLLTIKAVKFTRILDYVRPEGCHYLYADGLDTDDQDDQD